MPVLLDLFDSGNFIVLTIAAVIGVALQLWTIRVACRADEQVKNQKAMIWFLIKLCEKQGVEASEIENIREIYKIS